MEMKRILVYEYLSAGGTLDAARADVAALRAEGLAMREAIIDDLSHVPGLEVTGATCADVAAPASGAALSANRGESPLDFIGRVTPSFDAVWAVAPETGRLLERLHDAVGAARWLGCDAASIRLASSKQATVGRLVAHGVASPLVGMSDPRNCRWVVKPDDGAGCSLTRLHARIDAAKADWTERLRGGRSATLEPWVDGEAMSLSLLCGGHEVELLAVNRQRIALDADLSVRFEGVDVAAIAPDDERMPRFRKLAADVAAAIHGLRGFVGVDFVWHAEYGPVVIEVNPRVTSAYVGLSAALDRNVAADVLELHAAFAESARA
jgi:predicted ATP-grasp superfamily ATP-dependent carboligase